MVKDKKKFKVRLAQYIGLISFLLIFNYIATTRFANTDFPLSSNITIFLLININIILLLILVVQIFRNLAKTFLDRKKNFFGTRLQTKLVIFSIVLVIIPVFIVFTFSSGIINNSINRWFDVQIENALGSAKEFIEGYQEEVKKNLLEKSYDIAKVISKNGLIMEEDNDKTGKELKRIVDKYNVKGLAIYNNQKIQLLREGKKKIIKKIVLSKQLSEVMDNSSLSDFFIYKDKQVYWSAVPIKSNVSDVILGVLFTYITAPSKQAMKVNEILESYDNYKQIKFYKNPVKNSYKILLILMTLLVIFAGIWGSLVFSKSITEPLENLSAAAYDISNGNLDIYIEETGNDEVSYLIKSFNDMTKKLRGHDEELHFKNKKLTEMYHQILRDNEYIDTIFRNVKSIIFLFDVNFNIIKQNNKAVELINSGTDIFKVKVMILLRNFINNKNKNEQIVQFEYNVDNDIKIYSQSMSKIYDQHNEATNVLVVLDDLTELVELQRINIWKAFATKIAHEIKNPLTPIKLTAERIQRRLSNLQDNTLKELLSAGMKIIISETKEIYDLITEFNEFSRKYEMKKEEFGLKEFLVDIINVYKQTHPGIKFVLNANDSTSILADKTQLKRVILNLLNNSIYAVRDVFDGKIEIGVNEMGGKVIIKVRDNGTGVDKKDIPRIFTPYYTKRSDGTGLGLSIVKNIIEEHGGKITVRSEHGKYAEFTIVL
jgi:two-component system nitrogen regulation sensor histidine kinase NtrY